MLKDAGLVVAEAKQHGLTTPAIDAAYRLFQRGAAAGLGEDDITGIIRVYDEANGGQL